MDSFGALMDTAGSGLSHCSGRTTHSVSSADRDRGAASAAIMNTIAGSRAISILPDFSASQPPSEGNRKATVNPIKVMPALSHVTAMPVAMDGGNEVRRISCTVAAKPTPNAEIQKAQPSSKTNPAIGLETARQPARGDLHVIIGARDESRASGALADLAKDDLTAESIALDLLAHTTITDATSQIEAQHGRLDALVNNAGIFDFARHSCRQVVRRNPDNLKTRFRSEKQQFCQEPRAGQAHRGVTTVSALNFHSCPSCRQQRGRDFSCCWACLSGALGFCRNRDGTYRHQSCQWICRASFLGQRWNIPWT